MKYQLLKSNSEQKIIKLFTETFTDAEGPAEGKRIGNLVAELQKTIKTDDIFCFIAIDKEELAACIYFTRFTLNAKINAFILSPVAVATKNQRKGIGQNLIKFGIDYLKQNNVELVLTYGDPNFYSKVGFKNISEDIIKAPLKLSRPDGWLAQSLIGETIDPIKGDTMCVNALNDKIYW
jgi:putative acetyltransferase